MGCFGGNDDHDLVLLARRRRRRRRHDRQSCLVTHLNCTVNGQKLSSFVY